MTTTQIVEYSQTEAALAELRDKYAVAVFDVSSTRGMTEARSARAELRTIRVALEAKRKELKAPILERGKLLDDEAKRITAEIVALEEPIDNVIKAEEQRRAAEKAAAEEAERQRLAEIQGHINAIRNAPVQFASASSEEIAAYQDEMVNLEITLDDYAELTGEAMQAKQQTLDKLTELHAAAVAREAEQERITQEREELEKLRAEAAERERLAAEEADRAEVRARNEREAAEAEQRRVAEQQAAQQAEIDRQREELEAEKAATAKAEQDKRDTEAAAAAKAEQAKRDAEEKAKAEQAERERLNTRPTDAELIAVLAAHYRAPKALVIEWLEGLDLDAAQAA